MADPFLLLGKEEAAREISGPKGRFFKEAVWAYYNQRGAWSDGPLVALEKGGPEMITCCCPCMWLRRLYLSLSRATPFDVTCCACPCSCCGYRLQPGCCRGPCCAVMLVVFLTLIAMAVVGVVEAHTKG